MRRPTRGHRPVASSALLVLLLVVTTTWTAAAGARPADPDDVDADEVFGRADGTDLHVLVRRPEGADGRAPAVVLVHGGGWQSGSAGDMAEWAEHLVDAGWVTFSIDYRLSSPDRSSWPGALEDVQAGVEWVHDNAARHGADPARLVVFGESAGAHLATLVAVEGTGGDAEPVAVAAWSPPLELAELVAPSAGATVPGCAGNPACQEFWSMGWARWFLGCAPTECPGDYDAASPAGRVHASTTPLWIANSTDELVPLPPAERFAAELEGAGVEHDLFIVPGRAHAHGYGQRAWNEMVPWLAGRLGVEPPEPVAFGDAGDRTGVLLPVLAVGAALLLFGVVVEMRRERRSTT